MKLSLKLQKLRRYCAVVVLGLVLANASLAHAAEKTLLLYGDSLLAGYGLAQSEAFMGQLHAALVSKNLDVKIVNASVSGDTSAGGLARLDWALADKPDAVVLELGANDMLQGLAPAKARKNLSQIIEKLQAQNLPILLAGMKANRGLGVDYVENFDAIYPDLAAQYDVDLYPFYLDGVARDPALNQADMLHPNAAGVKIIVAKILPYIEKLIAEN